MKIPVLREKTFSKPIPSITNLIDFGGTNRAHIRKRDQLHSSGCEGVETGKLASACGQSKWERLIAVAVVIPPGHQIVRIEAMIYFGD